MPRLLQDRERLREGSSGRSGRGAAPPSPSNSSSSSSADSGVVWVLIADDSSAVQLALKRLVRTLGKSILGTAPNVLCVLDGAQAVKSVQQRKYALVLMDLHMPLMGGVEATKEIRKRFSSAELPVLAVTADKDPDYLLCEGFNDVIEKPVAAPTMQPLLEKYFKPAPALEREVSSRSPEEGQERGPEGGSMQQREHRQEVQPLPEHQDVQIDAETEILADDVSHVLTISPELHSHLHPQPSVT